MAPKKILVIDDDEKLIALLTEYLTAHGFAVTGAAHPRQGLQALGRINPDLVVLDIMLPEMDGFEVCRRIRLETGVPILMLTARGETTDRVVGLEMGADDYLPKPFEPRELVARIQAILRRSGGSRDSFPRVFGSLTVDPGCRSASVDGKDIGLTTNEFTLLSLLTRRPGRVFDRDEILQVLSGIDSDAYNRTVDITVSRLRQKLGDDPKSPRYIRTVRGAGYVFIGKAE